MQKETTTATLWPAMANEDKYAIMPRGPLSLQPISHVILLLQEGQAASPKVSCMSQLSADSYWQQVPDAQWHDRPCAIILKHRPCVLDPGSPCSYFGGSLLPGYVNSAQIRQPMVRPCRVALRPVLAGSRQLQLLSSHNWSGMSVQSSPVQAMHATQGDASKLCRAMP